ncbi:MAG: hypothetical protein CMM96_00905 [Rickettsiales bacterium]|nr:hypothetical protein [Rickettsiales bacterium]
MEYFPKHTNTGTTDLLTYKQTGLYVNEKEVENNRALHGDIVFIDNGKVTGIKKRNKVWIAGILHLENNKKYGFTKKNVPYYKFTPLSGKYPGFIVPTKRRDKRALYCAISINDWSVKNKHPIGQVEQYIGDVGDIDNETSALLYKNNIFPKKNKTTFKQILPPEETDVEYNTFSIDPPGCKDIDDALSYRVKDNGTIEIGIHIAHVGKYIDTFNSQFYSSVYLSDSQINMLDDSLTYNTLSLGNGTPKHSLSLILSYKNEGTLIKKEFKETIVKNKALCYSSKNKEIDTITTFTKKILNVEDLSTTKLVEHFMILYNSSVAEILYNYNDKTIVRTHKMRQTMFHEIDTTLKDYLGKINQSAALYSCSGENSGHEDLDLKYYTHATSPIRRYVDIINQINMVNYLQNNAIFIEENIEKVNQYNKNLRKFYNNYKKLKVIFSTTTDTIYSAYIVEIKNKKIKVYIPSLDIEHGFYPVPPKLFDCNKIQENENMLGINNMELKLYDKIDIEITRLPYENKFNKKLYVNIIGLNCLGDI